MPTYPISPSHKTSGLVYFARLIDKIRLKEAGKLGDDYIPLLGGGFDGRCCKFLGVSYQEIVERTKTGEANEAILEWCFSKGHRPDADEILIWNKFMMKRGWRDEDEGATQRLEEMKIAAGLKARSDIVTFFDLIDADEKR